MIAAIIVLALAGSFIFFSGRIISNALVLKNYITEKNLIPFIKFEVPSKKISKLETQPAQTPVTTSAAVVPAVTPIASPSKAAAILSSSDQPPVPSNSLDDVKFERYKNGAMRVTFSFASTVSKDGFSKEFLPTPPRYLLKVPGVNKYYKRKEFNIASPYLKGLRMGLHSNPDSLHIVLDMGKGVVKEDVLFEETQKSIIISVGKK